MINLSIVTLEKATDNYYIAGCKDSELLKLIMVANAIFDLVKAELSIRQG
ncbi:MAG: hypothetical protein AAGU10_08175 [Methanosarcina mazei]